MPLVAMFVIFPNRVSICVIFDNTRCTQIFGAIKMSNTVFSVTPSIYQTLIVDLCNFLYTFHYLLQKYFSKLHMHYFTFFGTVFVTPGICEKICFVIIFERFNRFV